MPSVSFATDTNIGAKNQTVVNISKGGHHSEPDDTLLNGNNNNSQRVADSSENMTNLGAHQTQDSSQLRVPTAMPTLARGFSLVPERLGKRGSYKRQGNKGMFGCEAAMQFLAYMAALLTLPFSLFMCLKVIAQYERAVVFRLGRLVSEIPKGPGLVFILPCLDNVKTIDLRTFTFNVPTQEVLTKDSVTVAVDAVVYYRIFDPVMSVVNVEDANRSTRLLAQTTLRNVLGTVDLYQLLTAREQIAHLMQDCLDTATETWGVKVERVDIKDVRLPIQLQRAMAAEAEAAREAKAKVIAAEGEQRASVALKAAAIEIGECPIALQLRYLQTLSSISDEKNSTIIFPLPIDLLSLFHQNMSNSNNNTNISRSSHGTNDMTNISQNIKDSQPTRPESVQSKTLVDQEKKYAMAPPPPPRETQPHSNVSRAYQASPKSESVEEDLI